jgi:uncharacterized protein (DUF1697 family)
MHLPVAGCTARPHRARGAIITSVATRIAFLRAVNVGRRKVDMARVIKILRDLNYDRVWTHANSGNAVFATGDTRAAIERSIEHALETAFRFEITTFVRSASELHKAVHLNPFPVADGDTYFVTFLKTVPSATVAKALEAASNDFDTLIVRGRDVHWRMHGRSTQTKLTRKTWDVVGHHGSTSRNSNLLRKLDSKLTA